MADAPDSLEPFGAVRRTRIGREATEPMREDIRLLGTILGDTVREQNGDEVFTLVERARTASFQVRRSEIERAEVAQLFDGIDIHQAIPVIRAFSHFALLANVAEDIHRERRRAIHTGRPSRAFRIQRLLRPHLVVPETKPLSQMLEEFREGRSHLAMVVDEFGTIVGMVTVEDVLEQVVGRIEDEHDEKMGKTAADGAWRRHTLVTYVN